MLCEYVRPFLSFSFDLSLSHQLVYYGEHTRICSASFSLPRTRLVLVQSKRITARFALSVSFFLPVFSLCLFLPLPRIILSHSLLLARLSRVLSRRIRFEALAHTALRLPSGSLALLPTAYLSPSLAIVRARIPPISVDRQCTHASSPSLCRESKHGHGARARARQCT